MTDESQGKNGRKGRVGGWERERELERQKKLEERRHRPLMLDLHSQPRVGERIIKRFPLVKQVRKRWLGGMWRGWEGC